MLRFGVMGGVWTLRVPGLGGLAAQAREIWDFPKIRVPYFGVLTIRILLLRVLHQGPLFSETPISFC